MNIFENDGTAIIRFAVGSCWLGSILVAATDKGICAILLGDSPEALSRELGDTFKQATLVEADAEFGQTVEKVVKFVESPGTGLNLALDVSTGTPFQQKVWRELQEIRPGTTVSYSELAVKIGMPTGARAVASACAQNPIVVAIPCHRVVRADGGLSGYRAGIDRKRTLLDLEAKEAGVALV